MNTNTRHYHRTDVASDPTSQFLPVDSDTVQKDLRSVGTLTQVMNVLNLSTYGIIKPGVDVVLFEHTLADSGSTSRFLAMRVAEEHKMIVPGPDAALMWDVPGINEGRTVQIIIPNPQGESLLGSEAYRPIAPVLLSPEALMECERVGRKPYTPKPWVAVMPVADDDAVNAFFRDLADWRKTNAEQTGEPVEMDPTAHERVAALLGKIRA